MESLHYGEMLGGYYINSGFYWGSNTGICYMILAGEGGRGGWGCGAEHRQWRMQRGGASVAVEKIEQASSAMIFSGTARRQGLRFAEEAVLQAVKYLLNLPHSSPPLRRGQGWWFALLRSSAGAIKMRRRHLISTV